MSCSKYFSLFALLSFSCTNSPSSNEPVQPARPVNLPIPTAPPIETPTTEVQPTPTPIVDEDPSHTPKVSETAPKKPMHPDCQVLSKFPDEDPVYIEKSKVMFTRITGACSTPDGQPGHLPHSGWMVMGFPCTGGEGRIDWVGSNYNAPKVVSFLLDTNCAMAPTDQDLLKKQVIEAMGLQQNATMIAFNPFMVQYWEFPGMDDADVAFTVDLRSGKGLTKVWNQFIKEKPIPVTLFGRENAWVPRNHLYQVDAEILWASKNRFKIHVIKAHVLKGDELNAVKTRCEALRPERDCAKVF